MQSCRANIRPVPRPPSPYPPYAALASASQLDSTRPPRLPSSGTNAHATERSHWRRQAGTRQSGTGQDRIRGSRQISGLATVTLRADGGRRARMRAFSRRLHFVVANSVAPSISTPTRHTHTVQEHFGATAWCCPLRNCKLTHFAIPLPAPYRPPCRTRSRCVSMPSLSPPIAPTRS